MTRDRCLDVVTAVHRRAQADPAREALTWLAGLEEPTAELTFGALDDAAAAVAAALLAHAAPGDRVLLVQPPGLEFVSAFVGSLYAGCVPVPVYPLLDTEENVAKVRRVLLDCGAALAWTSDEGTADYVQRALNVLAYWATDAHRHHPDTEPAPDALAFLQYTSGSTGDPRGVMVTHGNLAANLGAIRSAFQHDSDSRVLSWLPAYHDMGLIGNILHPLHTGCHVHLGSPVDFIRRPLSWLVSVSRYGITTTGAPNFAYDLVVQAVTQEGLPNIDLRTWRTAYCGAEPVSHRTLTRFADVLAPLGFDRAAFVPCYGLAEATLLVTSVPVGGGVATRRSPDGQKVVSCGVARDCTVAVVDGGGRPVPDGDVGEIVVRGPSVAAGYFNHEDADGTFGLTITDESGRWLRTGDLGFLDGGELYVTGRAKDVLVVRGRNHHPQDVERLVAEECPAVRPGCVAAFSSADRDTVVVVAELRGTTSLGPTDRRSLAATLASTSGLALHDVVAVPKGTVPKTTSGKLRRSECRARYLAGDYDQYRTSVDDPGPTDSGAEAVLAAVRAVLGADVAADEPLVAHGLDSLGALRLTELLLRRTGADVSVRDLLRGATTAELTAIVTRERTERAADAEDDHSALSKAQQSLLFLHMLNPASDEYAISFAWEPAQDTDFEAFDAALRHALSWRPELAKRFDMAGGDCRRVPIGEQALRDALSPLPVPVPDHRLHEQLVAAAELPFELDRGPLLRLYAWRTPTRRVYQLVVHHTVTDLWSLALVLRDIGSCYAELVAGRTPTPSWATSYDSYVREQEEYLASAAARARDEELRALLPTRARSLDIRTDMPYRPRRSARAGRVTAVLEAARSAVGDPVATTVALWAATLHRYGTPAPVVVGVPVSGRPHGRHGTMFGLCTNTVPIALVPDRNQPLAAMAAVARDQLEHGMDAGMYPLARAVEAVRPERVAGRHPLVETLITVQENPMPDTPGVLGMLNGEAAEVVLGALRLRTVPVQRRTCRYDLDMVVTPRPGGYLLALDFAADLFTIATAETVLATFHATLAAAFAHPDADLGDVLVLSERDEDLLPRIGTHDAGRLEPPPLRRVRALAATEPDRPAVESPAGTWGYGEFAARVDWVAAAVRAAGGNR